MKDLYTLVFVVACLLTPAIGYADKYPKNLDIDIQHYQFKLWLSDRNDSIRAEATLIVSFKKAGIQFIRLDLTSAVAELQGKGMYVTSIISNGNSLSFSHRTNELLINTPASVVGQPLSMTIKYYGIPDAGFAIKQNKYKDRSFFSDNWPDLGHHWLPLVDHPYDKATCEFIVIAPSHYKVV